ncbi:hypothetical protein EYF80_024361 [Liparis tanakae]|uniref:Uncharacterized protein n=1 Tax=Liparis tanakae TaxID=230148 RepID=A0A4Z2HIL0_9TELE|nr:hypothetical protein EYF80_024361 [Liparis tanakae]
MLGKPDTARISLCSMASRRGLRRARDQRRRTTALCFRFRSGTWSQVQSAADTRASSRPSHTRVASGAPRGTCCPQLLNPGLLPEHSATLSGRLTTGCHVLVSPRLQNQSGGGPQGYQGLGMGALRDRDQATGHGTVTGREGSRGTGAARETGTDRDGGGMGRTGGVQYGSGTPGSGTGDGTLGTGTPGTGTGIGTSGT